MSTTGAMWKNKRERLWAASRGCCHYCGEFTPEFDRTIDHVVPRAFGGPDGLWNLVACCEPCNGGHGDAVRKCECRSCLRTVNRFHREKLRSKSTVPVEWRRKHVSEDDLASDLLRRIRRCQIALDKIGDQDSHDAAALRGKICGLREALSLIAVNEARADAAV